MHTIFFFFFVSALGEETCSGRALLQKGHVTELNATKRSTALVQRAHASKASKAKATELDVSVASKFFDDIADGFESIGQGIVDAGMTVGSAVGNAAVVVGNSVVEAAEATVDALPSETRP